MPYSQIGHRVIRAPAPVDARTFYIFCHEIAHVILDHKYMDWGRSEIEADLWALEQLRKVRGWIPITVNREVNRHTGALVADALRCGKLQPADLVGLRAGKH